MQVRHSSRVGYERKRRWPWPPGNSIKPMMIQRSSPPGTGKEMRSRSYPSRSPAATRRSSRHQRNSVVQFGQINDPRLVMAVAWQSLLACLCWTFSRPASGNQCHTILGQDDHFESDETARSSCLTLDFTISQAADSACVMSPSFDVTATTIFMSGMNTTSAYHIVFDPLCQ